MSRILAAFRGSVPVVTALLQGSGTISAGSTVSTHSAKYSQVLPVYSEYDLYGEHMCTVSIISTTVFRRSHSQMLSGVRVGANCCGAGNTGDIDNAGSMPGFDTAHTASVSSISGFCAADSACTSSRDVHQLIITC